MGKVKNVVEKWRPSVYGIYYGILREIASDYGYALTLHGSMTRDLDLVAIPWSEEVKPVEEMLKKFQESVGFLDESPTFEDYELKPHGRRAYHVIMGTGYADISVMPCSKKSEDKTLGNAKEVAGSYPNPLKMS